MSHKSTVPSAILYGEITGRSIKHIRKLPSPYFSKLDHRLNSMPSMVVELEDSFYTQDAAKCGDGLAKISRRMSDMQCYQYAENRDTFVQFHGPEVLVKILKNPPQVKPPSTFLTKARNTLFRSSYRSANEQYAPSKLRKQCMALLRELCFTNIQIADWLAEDESLLVLLFSLLTDNRTFDAAIGLIEEILAVKDETFNLATIPDFSNMVRGFSKGQLGIFCRILAMVIFEPDDKGGDEVVSSMELLNIRKQDPIRRCVKNIDRNHAVIIGVPDLLSRIVKLLGVMSTPNTHLIDRIIAHLPATSDLIDYRRDTHEDDDDNNWDDVNNCTTDATNSNNNNNDENSSNNNNNNNNNNHNNNILVDISNPLGPMTEETVTATAMFKAFQVEILFVIYALLAGKRKADLQDELARIGLIPTLSMFFDTIDWLKFLPPPPPQERIHGPTCECNPESTLKIQFLRLVLNFCDGDFENRANKRLLLSSEELASLDKPHQWKDKHPPGLLMKLIKVFLKLPSDQPYRFWMSSCIEAFLRGSDPIYQRFVAVKSGLLQFLIDDIISEDSNKTSGGLQTAFDLLGELMKFNREIFAEFNKIMTGYNFNKFIRKVTNSLVDSNVFLRAMILSMERFSEEDKARSAASSSSPAASSSATSSFEPYPFLTCHISKFLASNSLKILIDLMTVISIEDINQENICCVNTALVLYIFSNRHGQLSNYLESARLEEAARGRPGTITTNFRKLLWFWNEYYAQRGRDCLSLEFSSQIQFSEWLRTYHLLADELGDVEISGVGSTSRSGK